MRLGMVQLVRGAVAKIRYLYCFFDTWMMLKQTSLTLILCVACANYVELVGLDVHSGSMLSVFDTESKNGVPMLDFSAACKSEETAKRLLEDSEVVDPSVLLVLFVLFVARQGKA